MNASNILSRGERAPDFVLPIRDGTPTRFYACAGGVPTVLIFAEAADEGVAAFIQALDDRAPQQIDAFVIQRSTDIPTGEHTVFADADDKVRTTYRLSELDAPFFFLLDPNLRVLFAQTIDDPQQAVSGIVRALQSEPRDDAPLEIAAQAPVLLIPNVLNTNICNTLIHIWETRGNEASGVEQSIRGNRRDILDDTNKKRRDHIVADEKLMRLLSTTIGRRIMPEIRKAFHFEATRFEGFKIACYDAAEKGFFRPHRDNLSPATAHRRFALTLLLNSDYEGGHLTFPEYGPHLYKPGPGNAIIFSCSHLHAVAPVTSGRRFALLSFLFGKNDNRTSRTI